MINKFTAFISRQSKESPNSLTALNRPLHWKELDVDRCTLGKLIMQVVTYARKSGHTLDSYFGKGRKSNTIYSRYANIRLRAAVNTS